MVTEWSLPCAAIPPAAVGCRRWQWGSRPFLTTIVKAELELPVDGEAVVVPAGPLVLFDTKTIPAEATLGLPYPQVTVFVHEAQSSPKVQLLVGAGARLLIDKHVERAHLHELAALPERDSLSDAVDFGSVEPIVPEDYDWSQVQTAPPDQRVSELRGDEWIAVRGLGREIFSRLPGVGASVVFYRGRQAVGVPSAARLESAHIDAERRRAVLLWRHRSPWVEGELTVVAGVAQLGTVPVFPHDPTGLAPSRAIGPASDDGFRGTSKIDAEDLARIRAALASAAPFALADRDASPSSTGKVGTSRGTPFRPPAPTRDAPSFRQTALLDDDLAAIRNMLGSAAPFAISDRRSTGRAPEIPDAPWSDRGVPVERPRFGGTMTAKDLQAMRDARAALRALDEVAEVERADEALLPPKPVPPWPEAPTPELPAPEPPTPDTAPPEPTRPETTRPELSTANPELSSEAAHVRRAAEAERFAKEQREAAARVPRAKRDAASGAVREIYASLRRRR